MVFGLPGDWDHKIRGKKSNNLQPYTSDAKKWTPPLDVDVNFRVGLFKTKRNKSPKWWVFDGDLAR